MFVELIFYCLFFLLSFFLIAGIGFLSTSIAPKESLIKKSFFIQFSIGLVVLVSGFSIFITRFETIHLIFLIPIVYYLFHKRQSLNFERNKEDFIKFLKNTTKFSVIATVFFSIVCLSVFDFTTSSFQIQHPDFHWYAKFSHGMYFSGHENSIGDMNHFFPKELDGMSPYHYFELWINAFFANLFSISYVNSLLLITYPILQFTCFLGVSEIVKNFHNHKSNYFLITLISFGLLFVSPIYFDFYENYELLKYGKAICHSNPMGFSRKYATIFIFGVLSMFLYLKNREKESLIFLSLIPVLSIGTLPGTLIGLFLFFTAKAIISKSWKYLLYGFLLTIPSILILTVYKINALEATAGHIEENSILVDFLNNRLNYKAHFFAIIFPLARVLLFFSPFFLILVIFSLKKRIDNREMEFLFLGLSVLFSGALSAGLALKLLHSNQLLNNILPLINVVVITFICSKIIDFEKTYKILILSPLILYHLVLTYSYLNQENHNFSDSKIAFSQFFKNKIIASIKTKRQPKIGYIFEDDSFFNMTIEQHQTPLAFANFSNSQPIVTNLNKCSSFEGYDNFYWPFNFYCQKRKNLSYREQLNGFVNQFRIDYLLISKNRLSEILSPYKIVANEKNVYFVKF